jgi:hypothetical protein
MKHTAHRVAAIGNLASRIPTDHPQTAKLHGIVSTLRNSVSAIDVLHSRPNPLEPVAAQERRVGKASEKLTEQAKAARQQINEVMQSGSREIQGRIDAKVKLKEDGFAQEIRTVYRGMTRENQLKMLTQLATENNGPAIAAIICSPTILTGITAEMQDRFRENIVTLHAPAEYVELKALTEAISPAWIATDVAMETAKDFANPQRLAEIEKLEREANEAEASFNASTQS